jgi:hypothetical protein
VHGAIIILPTPGTTYPFLKPYVEEIIVLGMDFKILDIFSIVNFFREI